MKIKIKPQSFVLLSNVIGARKHESLFIGSKLTEKRMHCLSVDTKPSINIDICPIYVCINFL